jgi:exodeoxyribonuclease VII large subunit
MGRITAEIGTVPGAPPANIPEWSVSELSAALKRTVEDAYGYVRVRGEVSGFRGASPSGHVYFRLKDDKAVLDAVIWKMTFGRLRVKPQEGLDVVVTGRLTTFAGSSKYQIIIDTLDPAGIGALMALLEERKKKLAAEGLFDEARKQLLPFLPEVIGVVTSPTGAVIRDILHRLADRFPRRVVVWPVKVQGESSAVEVAAAIEGFNALPERVTGRLPRRPDLIIVARGGGSLEDLWSFNEEIVVRAAAASLIPLISAVGHETDVTLIDFAADRRAPTPTAAAEMAVPVRTDLLLQVEACARRALGCWRRGQDARWAELRSAARALPDADEVLAVPRQRLDYAGSRLSRALHANAQIHRVDFSRIGGRLGPQLLRANVERRRDRYGGLALRLRAGLAANTAMHRTRIAQQAERIAAFGARAERAVRQLIAVREARAERGGQLLAAFSYRGVLARGFALIRDAAGRPLHTAAAVSPGTSVEIEFADGSVGARVEGARATRYRAAGESGRKPRARRDNSDQGSLF